MERPILAFLWDALFARGGWMDVLRDRHGRTLFFHSSDEAREAATEEVDHRGARWFSLQIVNLETGEVFGGGPIMGDPNRIPQHRQMRKGGWNEKGDLLFPVRRLWRQGGDGSAESRSREASESGSVKEA